jgi:hypothetical protein
MPQAMRLERFAELTARMQAGEKRSDVLASAQVDEEHWEHSQQFWMGKMADEAARNRFALSRRYAALFGAAQARLTKAAAARPTRPRLRGASGPVIVHPIPVAPPPLAPIPPVPPAPVSVPAVVPASVSTSPPGSIPGRSFTPLPASIPSYGARLTVEQLAAMRAEIAVAPEAEHPAVLQRFGLDATTWDLEEQHWQRRLAADKDLFARYLRQFQYCRSLLQRT